MRAELLSLARPVADTVARHLVATGQLLDEDPEEAMAHALAARRLASRIAVVREAVGLAAYAAGEWQTAIAELRTYHRMSGRQTHLAVLADCERALGRPERAVDIYRAADKATLEPAEAIELLIVAAGARGDMGQKDAAVAMLQVRELAGEADEPWAGRLRYAYADALLAVGRREEAREWFSRAADADPEATTDAAERLLELDGVVMSGDEKTDLEEDEFTAREGDGDGDGQERLDGGEDEARFDGGDRSDGREDDERFDGEDGDDPEAGYDDDEGEFDEDDFDGDEDEFEGEPQARRRDGDPVDGDLLDAADEDDPDDDDPDDGPAGKADAVGEGGLAGDDPADEDAGAQDLLSDEDDTGVQDVAANDTAADEPADGGSRPETATTSDSQPETATTSGDRPVTEATDGGDRPETAASGGDQAETATSGEPEAGGDGGAKP